MSDRICCHDEMGSGVGWSVMQLWMTYIYIYKKRGGVFREYLGSWLVFLSFCRFKAVSDLDNWPPICLLWWNSCRCVTGRTSSGIPERRSTDSVVGCSRVTMEPLAS